MSKVRKPLTITDEGNGNFVLSCDDKYTSPDVRWNIIGLVMEWFLDGEHVHHFDTAEGHKAFAVMLAEFGLNKPKDDR